MIHQLDISCSNCLALFNFLVSVFLFHLARNFPSFLLSCKHTHTHTHHAPVVKQDWEALQTIPSPETLNSYQHILECVKSCSTDTCLNLFNAVFPKVNALKINCNVSPLPQLANPHTSKQLLEICGTCPIKQS